MGGQVPPGYMDFVIMRDMGWTYAELMDTPAAVIHDIKRYMNTEGKYRQSENK